MSRSKRDSDQNRMEAIMNVDTPSLLKTLKEIESQLSSYQRQDKVPKWAEALGPRLDLVEKTVKNIMVPPRAEHSEGITLKDLEREEIFAEKIKKVVDGRTESLKLAFETKLASSALELDRLHKLLYIRPTTSELQQVMMTVRDVDSKVNKVHEDVAGNIQGIVQEKLTCEMEALTERLHAAEAHSNKAVEIVLNKVGEVEGDVRRNREGTKGEFDELISDIKKVQEEAVEIRKSIDEIGRDVKSVDERCQIGFEGMERRIEDVIDANNETETAANERMDGIEDSIAALEESLRDEVAKNEDKFEEMEHSITSLGENLEDFKVMIGGVIEGMKANQESLSVMLEKTIETQSGILEYVNKLEKFQTINKISDNAEAIQHLQEANQSAMQATNIIKQDIKEIVSDQAKMQETLDDVPNKIQVESFRIEAANKEITQLKEGFKHVKSELSNHSGQLDELSVLKVDMIMVKGVSEAQDDRIKKVIRQVVEAEENLEAQEQRLDAVVLEQEVKVETVSNTIETVRSDFEQKMETQHAEVEAKLEVLKETVESSGGGGGAQVGAKKRKANMKKNLKGSMGKITDENSAKRIIDMIEEEDEQKQETAEDLVVNETADKIEYLMQLSLNFEEIASFRNSVPRDIPNAICHDIAACAQSIASVVADTADLQAIQKMVRGAPQDIVYEDAVTQKRNSCLEQVIQDLKDKLKESCPDAGLVRLEARDMFLSRTYHAFQLAISKFDQVLTTGHTRLGRVSLPSCIACDRPLLAKAPRQQANDNANAVGGGGGSGYPGGSSQYTNKAPLAPIGHVHNPKQSFFEPTQSSTFGTQVGSLEEEMDALARSSISGPQGTNSSVRVPSTRAEFQHPEIETDGGKLTKGKEYAQYVKRGGFKMPPKLPQLSSSGPN